jgi:hypothetical protein
MFLTCVHEIFDLLSLSFKLDHCKKKKLIFFLGLLTRVTKIWPKLLIETKENEITTKL